MDEREGVQAAVDAVRDLGVDVVLDGQHVALTVDGARFTRSWRWSGATGSSAAVERAAGEGVILFAERFSSAGADLARARGQWFADTVGNAYLRDQGLLVDVRGRRRGGPPQGRGHQVRPAATNLMSSRRAQVVFCLLAWPDLVREPVRSIADVAGVSSGLAHLVLQALRDAGHLGVHARVLGRREELVDQWVGAYGRGLARTIELGRYEGEPSPNAWVDAGRVVRTSGEQAVPELLGGRTLLLYVGELEPRLLAASRWRRADGEPNVVLRRKFWTDPAPAAGGEVAPAFTTAPVLMVYADLLGSGDPRQREVARGLKEEILAAGPR